MLFALDRVLRAGRVFWNNGQWRRKNRHHLAASVELLTGNTIRLSMRRPLTWKPGQHIFLILPTLSTLPIEAHPFSIASIPVSSNESEDQEVVLLIRARAGLTRRLRDFAESGVTTLPALLDGPYGYPPNLRRFSTCVLIAGPSFCR